MLQRALNTLPRFSRRRFLATGGAATAGFVIGLQPRLLVAEGATPSQGSGTVDCEDDWIQWRLMQTGALTPEKRNTKKPDPPADWAVFEPEIPDNFGMEGLPAEVVKVLKPQLITALKAAYRTRVKVEMAIIASVDKVSYALPSPPPAAPGRFENLPVWLPGKLQVNSVQATITVKAEGLAANQFTTDGIRPPGSDPNAPAPVVPISVNPVFDTPAWVKLNGVDAASSVPLSDERSQEVQPGVWMVEKKPCVNRSPNLTIHHPEVTNSGSKKFGALKAWILYTGTLTYQIGWRLLKEKGDANSYAVQFEYGKVDTTTNTTGGTVGGQLKIKVITVGGEKKWEDTTGKTFSDVQSTSVTLNIAPPEIPLNDAVTVQWSYQVQTRRAGYKCHPTNPTPLDPTKTIHNATWGELSNPLPAPNVENPLPVTPPVEPP